MIIIRGPREPATRKPQNPGLMGSRVQALSLYKSLLRAARLLPTENRKKFAISAIRDDFRKGKEETDDEKIRAMFLVGHTVCASIQPCLPPLHFSEMHANAILGTACFPRMAWLLAPPCLASTKEPILASPRPPTPSMWSSCRSPIPGRSHPDHPHSASIKIATECPSPRMQACKSGQQRSNSKHVRAPG